MEKVLLPANANEVVKVRVDGFPREMEVRRLEGREYLMATDVPQGKEVKVAVHDITGIERIRRLDQSAASMGKTSGDTGTAIGTALIYAPLIPVAIVTRPFLRAMGLDEEKNSNEREKALLVYGGMTRDALQASLGAPVQRYLCSIDNSQNKFEIWSYRKEQMLQGGEHLFLSTDKGAVFYVSSHSPSEKNCSPLPMD